MKKKGDLELASGDYQQALQSYTNSLKEMMKIYEIDENDGIRIDTIIGDCRLEAKIFAKRSIVLLRMKQYYYAYEDAKHVTDILPEWFKGYLRLANIESECGLYEQSLKNYQLALRYLSSEPNESKRNHYDQQINETIKYQLFRMQRDQINDYQLIWLGTAIGMVFGMAIVFVDFVKNRTNSFINNPLLKLLLIVYNEIIAIRGRRNYWNDQQDIDHTTMINANKK
ncbi:hypothetical protein BLA29_010126 [Euroglyphus maynei]|uniref:Uncharacterized protein n=1 Tax=Euroglyphus maynei TaxID=6958 RepID=A0A1Y3AYQ3_EURMA|nr:hypothetical protein BLA29_010126 [Euroglyphus maynei]